MTFLLSVNNVLDYLVQKQILDSDAAKTLHSIEPKCCKNFNLLLSFTDRALLVKQEPHDRQNSFNQELVLEWQVHQLMQSFTALQPLNRYISQVVYFDAENSILVYDYLTNYCDLEEFYSQTGELPTAIAAELGATLANIHRSTFNQFPYQEFLNVPDRSTQKIPDLNDELDHLTPEIFSSISTDGLKFYELYQRDSCLSQAIAQLYNSYKPCCLTHNDLKLNNILLHTNWVQRRSSATSANDLTDAMIRLIDWEKQAWGDPTFDLGTIVAEYLKLWLKSLVVSRDLDIQTTLRLAALPLENVQPSLVALMRSYCAVAPVILCQFPQFLKRVVQFAGWALMNSIQTKLHYFEPFGNTEICMLQVAKMLLCNPLQSVPTVFGMDAETLFTGDQQPFAPRPPAAYTRVVPNAVMPDRTASEATITLEDIAQNVVIDPALTFSHPCYPPLNLSEALRDRFRHFSPQFQRLYLSRQLCHYLYDIYFSGTQIHRSSDSPQFLKNSAVRGIDQNFYEQLQVNNTGGGYFDSEWQVVKQSNSEIAVKKADLLLWVQPHQLLGNLQSPQPDDQVAVHLPHSRIESDFYTAIGDAGPPSDANSIELYFNVTAAGALTLMLILTQSLNAIGLPFCFKVLLHPEEYPRYEAGILQLASQHYETIQPVLKDAYLQNRSQFNSQTPLLTKPLAPGLGLAELNAEFEFGLHRCQIIAEALLTAIDRGLPHSDRLGLIHQYLTQQAISVQYPYLSFSASDRYFF